MNNYNWLAVRMLAAEVLERAIKDYRTLVPAKEKPLGSTGRPRKCQWLSAYNLLAGKSRGPGRMTMLDFCCQLVGVDKSIIEEKVLNDIPKRGAKNNSIRAK